MALDFPNSPTTGQLYPSPPVAGTPVWKWDGSEWVVYSGNGSAITTISASLGADVALNNTANYFDGPSVAQGSNGTWFVSGTVTLVDTAGAATFTVKLWDGTTVISSARSTSTGANSPTCISLSGVISSPVANIRISCRDSSSTSGAIAFNNSGNSKDSTITAMRVA